LFIVNNCDTTDPDEDYRDYAGPVYIYPPNGSTGQSLKPIFYWNAVVDVIPGFSGDYGFVLDDRDGHRLYAESVPGTGYPIIICNFPDTLESETTYKWGIHVYDGDNYPARYEAWEFTTGDGFNNPPEKPYSPWPSDNRTDMQPYNYLSWSCGDPDNSPVTCDVWLKEDSGTFVQVGDDVTINMYDDFELVLPEQLNFSANYSWYVIASDPDGGSTTGDTWTFTTKGTEPDIPSNLSPADDATGVSVDVTLRWTCSDEDGDPLHYTVWMASSGGFTVIAENLTESQLELNDLDYETEYRWYIYAIDDNENQTEGPIWSFTTEPDPASQQGIYAELTIHRSLWGTGDDWTRNDYVSARFDSVYAPDGPLYPRQPAAVNFGTADRALEWQDYQYYFSNPFIGYFLFPGGSYFFTITGGDDVPSLVTDSIVLPECRLEITSPEDFSWVSMDDGFEVVWSGYDEFPDCDRDVTIRIMDMGPIEWTDVNIVTENDGSYTFTAADLSGIDPYAYSFQITLIIDNKQIIIADGYDPRSWIWARVYTTQFIYRQ
jgi:hypothetical protein